MEFTKAPFQKVVHMYVLILAGSWSFPFFEMLCGVFSFLCKIDMYEELVRTPFLKAVHMYVLIFAGPWSFLYLRCSVVFSVSCVRLISTWNWLEHRFRFTRNLQQNDGRLIRADAQNNRFLCRKEMILYNVSRTEDLNMGFPHSVT